MPTTMSVCRACLYDGENLTDLDETFIHNYNALTGLKISHNDGLPQVKCETCMETVRTYAVFREKCLWVENKLQKKLILGNLGTKYVEIDVKDNVLKIEVGEEIKIKKEPDCNDLSVTLGNDTYYFGAGDNSDLPDHCDDFEIEDEKPKLTARKSVRKKSKPEKFDPQEKKNKQIVSNKPIKLELNCGLCPKVFQSRDKLNEHLEVHMKSKSCDICTLTFLNCSVMFRHRQIHIPEDQHYCHLCLKNQMYIDYHYRLSHFKETYIPQCSHCGLVLKCKKRLTYHFVNKHKPVVIQFECDECNKKFMSKEKLKGHLQSHNKQHRCKFCKAVHMSSTAARHHVLREHTPTMIKCEKCKRMYANQKLYDNHKCHEPKIVCPHCGKFVRTKQFKSHVNRHSGKRVKCEICSQTYAKIDALRIHMDKHNATPRFSCEYCQRKFYHFNVLVKHRRVHTGEKPYVCSICSKGFTANHNLKVHMKVHGFDLVVKKNSKPELISVFY